MPQSVSKKRYIPQDSENPGFALFWSRYPYCTAKRFALKAYEAAIKRGATHEKIMAGLMSYPFKPGYIPYPATWLNQDRWEGVILREPPAVVAKTSRASWRDKYDGGRWDIIGKQPQTGDEEWPTIDVQAEEPAQEIQSRFRFEDAR